VSERALDYVVRQVVTRVADLFPPEKTRSIERWVRGREESRKLDQADYAVVSAGKSGRTWLNVMLSKYFQLRFKLPEYALFSFDNLHDRNVAIPKVLFTHDNYIRDYNHAGEKKAAFYETPTILLVRHPADTAVSLFFHWQHRMQPRKKRLNHYPAHGADISVFDFVMHDSVLPSIVRFTNEWARELPRLQAKIVVRYEDLRAETVGELGRLLRFMGQDPTDADLAEAVAFASFENLKKLEAEKAFARGTRRLTAGDNSNPDSFKVRRAKVGGYRDYFTDEETAQIEAYIRTELEPGFGYEVVPS
jgi:hypothetical protein